MASTLREQEDALRGLVFDVKHFAVHDGPGVRTTVFLKGCPLRCWWCHSPESQSPEVEIGFYPGLCIDCGVCVEVCSTGAQTTVPLKIRRELCLGCGRCPEACYAGALVKFGDWATVEDVMREVDKDRMLYEASGGGVTLSGGEPTAQPLFASGLLKALKEAGYHIALDTCGQVPWETLNDITNHTDLVLYDLKHMDPRAHEEMTGATNELILSNLQKLTQRGSKTIIRVPVVPGLNDSTTNIQAMAGFLGSLKSIVAVELLPYHGLGAPKYEALGREYQLGHLHPPTMDSLEEIRRALEAKGLKVIVEGVG